MRPPIVVIGGGPAGSICARQLARLGHDVLLCARSSSRRPRIGEICGPGTRRLLEGVCNLSLPRTVGRLLTTFSSAWGSEEVDVRHFAFWSASQGLALDRMAFDEWLLRSAEHAGVTVLRGSHVVSGWRTGDKWELSSIATDGTEQTFAGSFIVEATGRHGRSETQPGVGRIYTDSLVCVSVELPEQLPGDPLPLVESCREGWWYSIRPLNGGQIVALFTDADLVEPAETRLDWLTGLLDESVHIRGFASQIEKSTRVHVCDARTSVRNVLWRRTWIAIGDAGLCLDPLSGTGIERAVSDGVQAAAAISQAVTSNDWRQVRAYALSRAQSFQQALAVQCEYYRIEQRWRDAAFWHRRNPRAGDRPASPAEINLGN